MSGSSGPESAPVDDDATAPRREEPPDLRLVLPAIALWAGAFVGTGWPARFAAVLGTGSVVVLAGASWAARQQAGSRSAGSGRAGSAWAGVGWTAVAAVLCLSGGLTVGAAHRSALALGEIEAFVAQRAAVSGAVTVSADPRRVTVRGTGSRRRADLFLVPARLDRLLVRGRAVRLRAPVLLLASDSSWSRLLPGQRVHVSGRLGPARAGQPVSAVLSVRGPPRRVGEPPLLQRAAGDLRAGLRAASDGLGRAERGLLPGLVLGDTSRVPADLTADFRTAGLTHLTAVSGANLAIVTGFVLLVGRRAGVRGRWLPLLAAVAMAGFVVLARPQPSVLRAAAMGAIALAALATGRRRRSLAALGAAAVVLLLWDPWLSRSYGFALSVLATAGLVVLAPGWARRWQARGLPRVLAHSLAVPLAAQLACAPVVVMLSGQLSLVAVPANLLAAPAVAPATVLGVLATLASAVHEPTAGALAWAAGIFVRWVVVVARQAADVPLASVPWPGTLTGALLLAAASVVSVLVARPLSRRPWTAAAAAVVLAVALAVPASRPGWPPPGWLLAVCDVGQGDALVLSAGAKGAVVVDTGPDPGPVDRCLRRLGVTRVPLVVLTHLHADHVEGLPGVLRGRQVGAVHIGPYDEPVGGLRRVLSWAGSAGVPVTRTATGARGRVGPLTWRVLGPARVIQAGSVPNNASVVLLVRHLGVSMLLTGDIEPEAQRALLGREQVPLVDVLKVAHHGSAEQAPELLAAVRPRVALVSVGADNDYGHPAASTLAALTRYGTVVGRTDLRGTLVVAGSRRSLRLFGERG